MKFCTSLLLHSLLFMSVLGAESTEDNAIQILSQLEPKGFHIRLEEPHPWNIRDHDVWEVWISDEGNVKDLLAQATPHLRTIRKPIQISLMGRELEPSSLQDLNKLQNLRYLILANTNLTDKILRRLDGIESLWEIDISDTFATASGMMYLARCNELKTIQAYSLDLTGKDFEIIQNFSSLEVLSVSGSRIDTEGWNHISTLNNLTELRCKLTHFTDDALRSISKLDRLQTLIAYSTQITDNGIRHLKNMQSLRFVFLDNNDVSDDSIDSFYELNNLQQLGLRRTKVTEEALRDLSARLPDLYIISEYGAIGNEKNKDPVGEPFFRGVREIKTPPEVSISNLKIWGIIGSAFTLLIGAFYLFRKAKATKYHK